MADLPALALFGLKALSAIAALSFVYYLALRALGRVSGSYVGIDAYRRAPIWMQCVYLPIIAYGLYALPTLAGFPPSWGLPGAVFGAYFGLLRWGR